MSEHFIICCKTDDLDQLMIAYHKYREYINRSVISRAFIKSLIYQSNNIAQWLIDMDKDSSLLESDYDKRESMVYCCMSGKLKFMKYINDKYCPPYLKNFNDALFRKACRKGQLRMAKWLLKNKPDIDVTYKDNKSFYQACLNGHLKLAKWLIKIKPDIDTSIHNSLIFLDVCSKIENIKVAKWLYSIQSDKILKDDNLLVLQHSYYYGYYNLCKWLLQIKNDWDISFLQENYYQNLRWINENNEELKYFFDRLFLQYHIKNYRGWLSKRKQSIENIEKKDCSICLSVPENTYVITPCDHLFCVDCINSWISIQNICPYCRQFI